MLSRIFRGKFVAELKQLVAQNKLQFHGSQQYLAAPGCFATCSTPIAPMTKNACGR